MDDAGGFPDSELAVLMRGLADAVLVCDAEGAIVFWNDAATRVFAAVIRDDTERWQERRSMRRELETLRGSSS